MLLSRKPNHADREGRVEQDNVSTPSPAGIPAPSRQSLRGLDWFIFFLADVQTGFGPFIAVYLTTQKWTQVEIGLVLSIGGIVALIGQMPGGAIIDAAKSERLVAGLAIATIGCCALAYAAMPIFPVVVAAATLHAAAKLSPCARHWRYSPMNRPTSSSLAGRRKALSTNARITFWAHSSSLPFSAAVMGTAGYLLSSRSVFLVTFLLAIPTLIALSRIREHEVDIARCHGEMPREAEDRGDTNIWHLIRQRPLIVFALSVLLLQLANASMMPLMASAVTARSSEWATVLVAFCIVVPQAIVALLSPSVGRKAQAWGRRPLLLIGFAALTIRGLLFATVRDPYLLVLVQVFDGLTAAVFAVMIPLIVADVAFGSGHFNLAQGIVGTAMGIGASMSTALGGYVSDKFGNAMAFTGLSGVAATGLLLILLVMPETRRKGMIAAKEMAG